LNDDKEEGRMNKIGPFAAVLKHMVGADYWFSPEKIEVTKKKFKEIEEIGK